jgi:monothiol glutaredoxin
MTNDEIRDFITRAIDENSVMLFMKGTPDQPACGFSMRASAALNALGVRYAALDVLPDQRIRQELSAVSDWPTIPQLFVNGQLVGGSDIVLEMYESGELASLLGVEQPDEDETPEAPAAEAPESAPIGLENRLEK